MEYKKIHHDINSNVKVFAYRRVSSKGQKGGFRSQKSLIEAYAKQHGLVIDEWFEDFAVSANKVPITKRNGYMAMDERCEDVFYSSSCPKDENGERIKPLVLVSSIDRLMRRVSDDWSVLTTATGFCQIIFIEAGVNFNDKINEMMDLCRNATQENIELVKTKIELLQLRLTEPCRHFF